ncbi:unnamed protein product, partial [Urochloa humidicola]
TGYEPSLPFPDLPNIESLCLSVSTIAFLVIVWVKKMEAVECLLAACYSSSVTTAEVDVQSSHCSISSHQINRAVMVRHQWLKAYRW